MAVTSDGSVWMSYGTGLLRINPNSLNVITTVKEEKPVEFTDKIACYPNPFNNSATIKYYLDKDSPVTVEIYNSVGQKIRTVLSSNMKSGFNFSNWNGTNEKGERVATGFYTVVVRYSDKLMSRRVLFLK
jgi:flagellar hook assembly protein FlgD